jgi:hypothetical protein
LKAEVDGTVLRVEVLAKAEGVISLREAPAALRVMMMVRVPALICKGAALMVYSERALETETVVAAKIGTTMLPISIAAMIAAISMGKVITIIAGLTVHMFLEMPITEIVLLEHMCVQVLMI